MAKQEQSFNADDVMKECGTFKANPVPWYCKVNLFKRMMENDK